MFDPLPRHIRDVQQTVNTAKIDKGTVVGEIFNHTFDRLTLLQILQKLLSLGAVRRLHHRSARYHNVVALLIELDDFEFEFLAL